jgi:hypothetical protein
MKRYLIILALVILGIFSLLLSDRSSDPATEGKIMQFSAEDINYDDGSGVLLRWKPLDKSKRIIQYNVYRGVHPDSLFFLSHLEVDPKMGVLSDELFFYDKDYPTLVDFETAPGKIKREKDQREGSPLLKGVPRDPAVLANILDRYSVLGMVGSKVYYKHSKKLVETDSTFTAGLKLNQFEYILANVVSGQKYYYTVLGVNERGQYLPFADVKDVVPEDNRPDPTATVNSVLVTDNNELRLEWNPPSVATDIALWEGWLVPKAAVPAFEAAQARNAEAMAQEDFAAEWKGGARQIFQIQNMSQSSTYYHTVAMAELGLPAAIDPEAYALVLGYMDYSGSFGYSMGKPIHSALSSDIPTLPDFRVLDKRNDKGDNLYISIGKPLVMISQAAYTNAKRNNLRINYEISANEAYGIQRVRFQFFDESGAELGTITEHYLDQIVNLKLPENKKMNLNDITVKIAVLSTGEKDYPEHEMIQHLAYDQANRRFSGTRVELAGQKLNRLYYDLISTNKLDNNFVPGIRMGGMSRGYTHTINYEDMLYQPLMGYDKASHRFKLNPFVTVDTDTVYGAALKVPLFKEEFEGQIKELERKVAEGQHLFAVTIDTAKADSIRQVLAVDKATLEFTKKHPAVLEAAYKKGKASWLKVFLRERDKNFRSYAYQMLVTNGRGLYNTSDIYSKAGSSWFYPRNEWFDDTKVITLIASLILFFLVLYGIFVSRSKDPYIRPIAGLAELDNAVGRATEMGRPVMFVPGWGTLGDPCTISAMMILSQVARKTAEFDVRLISPHVDYFVVPLAQEVVKTAYSEIGRPDSYNQNDIFYVSDVQFAFSAAVNGITIRDRVATIFYMGYFNAEALLMTETGNQCGAIQIAASDAITQIPFFITTCDYTLIGEEFYAASAYLSKNPDIVSMLKAQDGFKLLIVVFMIVGTILSSLHMMDFINAFPVE